jgi:FAM32A
MPSEDYVSTPSTGKLKLKGVKDSKVTKKKRHKSPRDGKSAEHVEDNSIMLKKLEVEDREMEEEERWQQRKDREGENENERDEDSQIRAKTEAERRYEDQRRKRVR